MDREGPEPRKGMPSPRLDEAEFKRRFRAQFQDRAFDGLERELGRIADAAWDAYDNSRKSPRTRKAGPGFADPDYELSLEWIAAREAVQEAQRRHEQKDGRPRILLVNASARSERSSRSRRGTSCRPRASRSKATA